LLKSVQIEEKKNIDKEIHGIIGPESSAISWRREDASCAHYYFQFFYDLSPTSLSIMKVV